MLYRELRALYLVKHVGGRGRHARRREGLSGVRFHRFRQQYEFDGVAVLEAQNGGYLVSPIGSISMWIDRLILIVESHAPVGDRVTFSAYTLRRVRSAIGHPLQFFSSDHLRPAIHQIDAGIGVEHCFHSSKLARGRSSPRSSCLAVITASTNSSSPSPI